jgi:hypothetical protein
MIDTLNRVMADLEQADALGLSDVVRRLARVVAAMMRDHENRVAALERKSALGVPIL